MHGTPNIHWHASTITHVTFKPILSCVPHHTRKEWKKKSNQLVLSKKKNNPKQHAERIYFSLCTMTALASFASSKVWVSCVNSRFGNVVISTNGEAENWGYDLHKYKSKEFSLAKAFLPSYNQMSIHKEIIWVLNTNNLVRGPLSSSEGDVFSMQDPVVDWKLYIGQRPNFAFADRI